MAYAGEIAQRHIPKLPRGFIVTVCLERLTADLPARGSRSALPTRVASWVILCCRAVRVAQDAW